MIYLPVCLFPLPTILFNSPHPIPLALSFLPHIFISLVVPFNRVTYVVISDQSPKAINAVFQGRQWLQDPLYLWTVSVSDRWYWRESFRNWILKQGDDILCHPLFVFCCFSLSSSSFLSLLFETHGRYPTGSFFLLLFFPHFLVYISHDLLSSLCLLQWKEFLIEET